jgi:hypothetical protein
MNLPKYQVSADDERFLYEFFSEGPRGSIKKTVIYSEIEDGLFNLAFGDWNENLNKLGEIIEDFEIQGYMEQEWRPFQKGVNYEAFLILNREIIALVTFALLIASPLAWYGAQRWLQNFAYRITIPWWLFPLAGVAAMAIASLTISTRVIRAAIANPIKSLRAS